MTNSRKPVYRQYENCISLGWFCGCASSLSKLGLRSMSGPFDWCFSDYWAVLEQIETEFKDFMKIDNLEVKQDDKKAFIDKRYGFLCNHDIYESFEDEMFEISAKYQRRAQRFLNRIIRPTLFFRVIKDEEEINFINENWSYAERLVKQYNKKNEIIYVVKKGMEKRIEKVPCFCLETEGYSGETYEMRHLFDTSNDLIEFCSSIISVERKKANLLFDKKNNVQKINLGYVNKCIDEHVDGIDIVILEGFGVDKSEGIYLWGAGKYGTKLLKYLVERNVNVLGIIDNSKEREQKIEGVPISGFDVKKDYTRIFISVASEKANEEIVQQIKMSEHKDIKVLRFKDLILYEDLSRIKG